MLQKVEQILFDDAAFIPLYWQNLAWAARKGVQIDKVVNVMNFPYLVDMIYGLINPRVRLAAGAG